MIEKRYTYMKNCKSCEYKENCKLGLYAVSPCELQDKTIRSFTDLFAPVVHKFQNPFTGKFQDFPVDEYYIKNPFMYENK